MNFKKIANEGYEEHVSTRTHSRHGVGPARSRIQRLRDRAAKRKVERLEMKERCNEDR